MGKYLIDETTLTNIANAIRTKTNSTEDILVTNFANEILNIQSEEDLSAEITAQEEKIAEQDTIIANLMTALEDKAASDSSTKTTKTIYLDWSEDKELVCRVSYVSNNTLIELWANDADVIEAEGGVVCIYEPSDYSYYSDSFILLDTGVLLATLDGGTIHLVSTSGQ